MLRRRVEFEQEESSSKQTSLVVVSNNSARDNMLASLFKAHELMETRVKPLRVPFGEIHMLERTLQNIAACYDDVACFLRMNEAAEDLSSQDRFAILPSIRETVRVMSVIEPYIPIRIESSFLNVRVVSSHVLDELGDIVFVELPQVGDIVGQGDEICVIESVKAASEVLAPCSGRVIEINEVLDSNPQVINQSAEEEGWFYRLEISDFASLSELMDSEAYETFILRGEE